MSNESKIAQLERLIPKLKANKKILPSKVKLMEWELKALKLDNEKSAALELLKEALPIIERKEATIKTPALGSSLNGLSFRITQLLKGTPTLRYDRTPYIKDIAKHLNTDAPPKMVTIKKGQSVGMSTDVSYSTDHKEDCQIYWPSRWEKCSCGLEEKLYKQKK
jgi:hypothetical protein